MMEHIEGGLFAFICKLRAYGQREQLSNIKDGLMMFNNEETFKEQVFSLIRH